MKRIFLVLALLTIAMGMAFSVTGKVFVRYTGAGPVVNPWGDTTADLFLGKRATGFDVNFDGFTFEYLLRNGATLAGNQVLQAMQWWGVFAGADATSPGYFRVDGLKAGPVSMGVGLWWSTLMRSKGDKSTNAGGDTNDFAQTFNQIYVDYTFNMKLADKVEIQIRDWDRLNVLVALGSVNANLVGVSNVIDASSYSISVPVWVTFGGDGWNAEVSLRFNNSAFTKSDISTVGTAKFTNDGGLQPTASASYGVWARGGVDINEMFGIWAGAKFWLTSDTMYLYNRSTMSVPLFLGLLYKMAPGITWDIGIGYNIVLNDTEIDRTTTNAITSMGFSENADLSDHWNNPFLKVGATGKAGEWELGLNFDVQLEPADATTTTLVNGLWTQDYATQILKWAPNVNFDDEIYLQWTKDQIQIRATFANVANPATVMDLFSRIDMTVMF